MKLRVFLCLFSFAVAVFAQDGEADVEASGGADGDVIVDGFSVDDRAAMEEGSEKHEFQAEVNRLMDIIINSLYTQKEVFLRELISNAADALEKARFHSLQDESYLSESQDLDIKIEHDPDAKTLSITDTGVGMTKADLINNLGTVAKSGTTNFLEAMADGADANLIGQFGVGFYSAFLVADKVTVTSKHNEDVQHVWESSADASFSIMVDPRGNTLGRGSRVTLHLKEDAHDFLNDDKVLDLTKKYSQFIQFPIYVRVKKEVDIDADEDEDDEEEEEEADEDEEEGDVEEEKEPKKPGQLDTVLEWEQLNTQKAIWLRSKDDVDDEEYKEFYKSVSKDYLDPLTWTHFSAEGEIEFRSILYLPKKAPFDIMDSYQKKHAEVKLYVRRVLVAEKFEDLLPKYLNFIKGVVDSDDLPLNVSREALQQNKIMKVISKKLVRKILELMKKLAKEDENEDEDEDEEDEDGEKKEKEEDEEEEDEDSGETKDSTYMKFYAEFGKNLKLGCYEDDSNRSKISKLLRFVTTKSGEKQISLDAYLDNMMEGQQSIYYIAGDDLDVMHKNPNLQMFRKKDLEVLMFTDHLDETCIQKLADYEGKKFVSVQKADVKLDETEDEKKKFEKLKTMYDPLTKWWKELLEKATKDGALKDTGVKIETVAISKRLTKSPVVVVSSQFGHSAYAEKIMRAQANQNKEYVNAMVGSKTLEINPHHPVIRDLLKKVNKDQKAESAKETALVLFQVAMLDSGYDIRDPSALVDKMYTLMSQSLGVSPKTKWQEIEVELDDEEEDAPAEDEEVEVINEEAEEVVEETAEEAENEKEEL